MSHASNAEPGMTLEFADRVMRGAPGRYRIVFGLGSTVDTVTFDVSWWGGRDDGRAAAVATGQAKAMEPMVISGTREVVLLSCEYLEQAEEGD